MSRVITMIPARMASSRLPNKILLDVNGKSVLQRVYENVKAVIEGDASYRSIALTEKYLQNKVSQEELAPYIDATSKLIFDLIPVYYSATNYAELKPRPH